MFNMSRLPLAAVLVALLTGANATAQTLSQYRGFALGASVEQVAEYGQLGASTVSTLHRRPALIQTMSWSRPYASSDANPLLRDPVRQIEFSFYDNQLYRLVVEYDADRTRGMTRADMLEALTSTYGQVTPARSASARVSPTDPAGDAASGLPIGRWENDEVSVVLYEDSGFYAGHSGPRYTLVLMSPRLTALSQTAALQATRLDQREAPQRELDRQKKQADADRASQEKARTDNKAAFKP